MAVPKQGVEDRGRRFHDPEAAEYLGLSPATLPAWRSRGRGPRFHKLGRRVIYFERDLAAYLDRNATDPEAV